MILRDGTVKLLDFGLARDGRTYTVGTGQSI